MKVSPSAIFLIPVRNADTFIILYSFFFIISSFSSSEHRTWLFKYSYIAAALIFGGDLFVFALI